MTLKERKRYRMTGEKPKKVEKQIPPRNLRVLISSLDIPGEWIQHSPGTWRRKKVNGNN